MRLDRAATNRVLLRKQHLAPDTHASVQAVMQDLIGLHATEPRSPYLQLHARVDGFDGRELDALLERGRAAKVACMRGTLFIQSADLIPLVLAATQRVLRRGRERYLAENGLTLRRYKQLAGRVGDALGPQALTARQIREALGTKEPVPPILHLMCDEARIIRWRGPEGWRKGGHTYRVFDLGLHYGEGPTLTSAIRQR